MSSSTEEPVDEQVSPELKQTVVGKHPPWEEVDKELILTPKYNDQVSTSILSVFSKDGRTARVSSSRGENDTI